MTDPKQQLYDRWQAEQAQKFAEQAEAEETGDGS